MTAQRYAEAGGRKLPLVRRAEVRVLPVEEDDAAGVGTFIIPFAFRGVIDSFGSFVYPTAFSHITDAKPLTRDHEWSPTYGAGDIEVDPETEARIVGQFHATAAGQALRRELIELASKGVRLEASVGMSPIDWKIRRGGEITDQDRRGVQRARGSRARHERLRAQPAVDGSRDGAPRNHARRCDADGRDAPADRRAQGDGPVRGGELRADA